MATMVSNLVLRLYAQAYFKGWTTSKIQEQLKMMLERKGLTGEIDFLVDSYLRELLAILQLRVITSSRFLCSIGVHYSPKALLKISKTMGVIYPWAEKMMCGPDFKIVRSPRNISLFDVAIADLGFARSSTREEVFERAGRVGLKLCPAEVGPMLFEVWDERIFGQVRVAMAPLRSLSDYSSGGFSFGNYRGEGKVLSGCSCDHRTVYQPDDRLIFTR